MKPHSTSPLSTQLAASAKKLLVLIFLFICMQTAASAQQKLRVVVAGLNHDHIFNILNAYKNGQVDIVGIVETNKHLQEKYGKQFHLSDDLFFDDLKKAVQSKKPDAVLGYNAVGDHLSIVEVCAPLGVPVMVEKPLAATLDQAKQIEALSMKYHVKVLVNFETTWYASYHDVYNTVGKDSIGQIRKMIVHDGHQGPKEINCSPEFLSWLTDPIKNGAGAMNDFGCYGADLMTWFMKGQRPIAVTAIARHYKPEVYPKVEDDATIMVEYPGATGLIEASWSWPFSIKDLEVFGETGYLHALDANSITSRMRENRKGSKTAEPLAASISDPISYLTAVLNNKLSGTSDLSSLSYNMIVMEILDAAKRSVNTGKRIVLENKK
ncbi:Gfo/Idh/MocA family protein [Pedobacter sp. L105]|uniref:Gfo/Idh/MocA family protein n=1 Tax=Pedobacter sp. L105 TaxID=1641871 RepID=UPI001C20C38C|nr:Gfo/Idh/MocA family oxidoreductase [Pedobacter sp. L105]